MSDAARRGRAMADELVRRATENAERQKAEAEANATAEAEAQTRAAADRRAFNDDLRHAADNSSSRRDALAGRIFPTAPDPEPSTRPEGSADGGEGEAEDYETEDVQTEAGVERMHVFDLDELDQPKGLTDGTE